MGKGKRSRKQVFSLSTVPASITSTILLSTCIYLLVPNVLCWPMTITGSAGNLPVHFVQVNLGKEKSRKKL